MHGNKNLFGVKMFSVKRKADKQQKKVLICKSAYFGPLCSASVSGSVVVAMELAIELTRNSLFCSYIRELMDEVSFQGRLVQCHESATKHWASVNWLLSIRWNENFSSFWMTHQWPNENRYCPRSGLIADSNWWEMLECSQETICRSWAVCSDGL